MKKKIFSGVLLGLLMMVITIPISADCTMQVNPWNNGWCAGEVDPASGEIIDYYCQDEAAVTDPWGHPLPQHCWMPPT